MRILNPFIFAAWLLVLGGSSGLVLAENLNKTMEKQVAGTDIQKEATALFKDLEKGSDMVWSLALTPALPAAWPPAPGGQTPWIRYAYARGRKFPPEGLADAERISAPWLRIEMLAGRPEARFVLLATGLQPVSIQGVRPLRKEEADVLFRSQEYDVPPASLPQSFSPDDPRLAPLRAYYRLWLQTNGAVAELIKANHVKFFEWISA